MTNFTHLHLHTQYSLLDGANLIPDLVQHLKETGMKSCAISDHGWMAGAVEFYQECKKNDIKPLLGVEAYITEDEDGQEEKTRDNMHMVLLAKDNVGYSRLLRLVTEAALDNFYYKPRIYKKKLQELSGHVIATSACLGGILAKKVSFELDSYGRAARVVDIESHIHKEIEFYASTFNNDFYLELQVWDSGDHYQPVFNKFLLHHSREMSLPTVVTADAHYLKLEDEKLHELLMAIQMKQTVEEYKESGDMLYGPHFYVADPEEMMRRAVSVECEEAYHNTNKIAEMCNVELELGKYKEPLFKIEEADDYSDFLDWKSSNNSNLECMGWTS